MKYAIFSDDFLSYFRLDDNGETLVLTDKRGYTRAVKLLPYEERPQGEWIKRLDKYGFYFVCNKCGFDKSNKQNFCSNCGADMRKEKTV